MSSTSSSTFSSMISLPGLEDREEVGEGDDAFEVRIKSSRGEVRGVDWSRPESESDLSLGWKRG